MTLLAAIGEVKPENIKLVVQRLVALKGDPGLTDKLADVTRALMALIQDYGLTRELGADLVRFARSMLKKVSATQRLKLTLGTASTLLQLGETAEAETLVAGVKGKYAGADERLWIARVEADIHWFDEDRDGAADILVHGLAQGASAEPSQRMMALEKLVGLWPEGREGIDPWLQEFETATKNLEEPHRGLAKVTTALAALRSGRPRDAEALVKSVDLARLEREAPDSLRRMVRELREGLEALGSTKRGKR